MKYNCWPTVMETSCGVILCNYGAILLLQYPQGHWDFPKGHLEKQDANKKAAAIRELAEETGIRDAKIVDGFEDKTEYTFTHKKKKISKQVWWYIAETETIEVDLSHEHQDYLWLEWDEAKKQLTHDESRAVLQSAHEFMKKNR